jgi:hypothetical protein
MELYVRFVGTLAFGLFGIGTVLKILLDELFAEWDAVADAKAWYKSLSERKGLLASLETREDVMLARENANATVMTTRLLDERRERLKELSVVEHRLNLKKDKISLTPLPRTPVDTVSAQS